MSNQDEKPWWAEPTAPGMYTKGANERVCNALMRLDNELTASAEHLTAGLKEIYDDHPELKDTAVTDFLGEALWDIVTDYHQMMLMDDECEPGFEPEPQGIADIIKEATGGGDEPATAGS